MKRTKRGLHRRNEEKRFAASSSSVRLFSFARNEKERDEERLDEEGKGGRGAQG